jgi:lambda family phage tail tape measure protein
MATIDNYRIKITVDGQEKVVDLVDSLDKLQTTLNRTAAAGIAAFTALGVSAVRMADQMVDVADAIGVSAGRIYQLNAALEQAGGQFGNAGGLLRGFSQSLGDVQKGSKETLDALYKLGLSKDQIENLSDDQLFQAVVDGLGKMEAGFERNRLGMILMGKAGDGVDWTKMSEGSKKAVDPELTKRLELAGEAMGQIEKAFRQFQLAALQAITPVLESIKDMNITADDARKAIQVLGALIAGAFAASTVIQLVKIVQLVRDLGGVMRAAGAASAFLVGLSGVGLAAVAASAAAAIGAYKLLGDAMENAADSKAKLEGTAPATPGAPATAGGKPARKIGKTPEQEAAEKQLASLQAQTAEMKTQNAAALEYERIINDTIGLSQEIADIKKIDAQLEQDRAKSAANYEKQIAVLRADKNKDNSLAIAELEKQQKLADDQLVTMAGLKKNAVERSFAEKETAVKLQKQLGILQEQTRANIASIQAEQQRKVIAGEITQEEANNIVAIARIREEGANKVLQLEKQIASEKDTIRKQELQNQLDATKKQTDFAISEKQREIDEKKALEQSYAAGAVQALEQIADAFKPYKMAQDAITKTWGNISNAVDQFVETGKFKFSDFARSVIQDLAKMILKAQIFKAIQATLGFFGFSIPGLAAGGPAKANQPYIVGEKGPELFVPKSAGTVIPNNQLSASTEAMGTGRVNAPVTNNYITNNISALDAKSVAQLFAENRKTLLGVTETARREMAYGT